MSGNAQIIQIAVTAPNAPLRIDCGLPLRAVIGTQGDHNAQELEFVRPREFAAYDLRLSFRDRRGVEYKRNIRKRNKFLITSELTQTTEVSLQITFERGVDFRRGTNALIFSYRPRRRGKLPPPEPIPDPVADLIARVVVDGSCNAETGEYDFYNKDTDTIFSLPAGGGGGGGTVDHRQLSNRDADDQHPIKAITGLQEILDTIPNPMTAEELRHILMEV